jgi:alpha-glucosidase (family GH31 glycosyl hydrolase)
LFVKGGSVLPLGPIQQSLGHGRADDLELRVYPLDGRAEFTLYDDGGASRLSYDTQGLNVSREREAGPTQPRRRFRVRVAGRSGETTIEE